MAKPIMTRDAWIAGIRAQIVEVGDCDEWQGAVIGKTPVAYTPQNYLFEGNVKGKHAVRQIVWLEADGARPPEGSVLRPKCRNDRCVKREHMQVLDRPTATREQFRRGEFDTPGRRRAAIAFARTCPTAKLSIEKAREIRASSESNQVLAERYGVRPKRIYEIRTGRAWPEVARGASVFNFRG